LVEDWGRRWDEYAIFREILLWLFEDWGRRWEFDHIEHVIFFSLLPMKIFTGAEIWTVTRSLELLADIFVENDVVVVSIRLHC
jgi:hypothetical protein